MKYKISIIVPCYNVENTIERCINSIINQSFPFEDIELILSDDASTDSTKNIIQKYFVKYENIIFIDSDTNKGPGNARNEGIKAATADYIMFIDSDDEFDLNLCELFYNKISGNAADIVCCVPVNIINDSNEKSIIKNINDSIKIKKDEIIYFSDVFIFDKIYKRDIIINNNILFPEHRYGEDLHFNIRYFCCCNELIYFPEYCGYYRHVQNDSISRSWKINDLNKLMETFSDIYDELSVKELNINFNRLFKMHIDYILAKLCTLHLLDDKSNVIHLLKDLYLFEQKISFNGALNSKVFDIANNFLLKKHFGLVYYYLKCLEKLYSLDKIKNLYIKLIN